MNLPCTVFETMHQFNDVSADDMQYGDMDEQQLRALGLDDISTRVDPYRLICYDYPKSEYDTQYHNPFYSESVQGRKISHNECAHILFDEMKELSGMFSFWGKYSHLIGEMIDHLRDGKGSPYSDSSLDDAYQKCILEAGFKSSLTVIKKTINNSLTGNALSSYMPLEYQLQSELRKSILPKFNRTQDRFNGLGITVHDVCAQRIKLLRIQKYATGWSAWFYFEGQDHFGLDVVDIRNPLYRNFRFFRIWFFLQRHRDFAFRPFFTNFKSIVMVNQYI